MSLITRTVGDRLSAYFDPRFRRLNRRIGKLERSIEELTAAATPAFKLQPAAATEAALRQAELLAAVDLRRHNAGSCPPTFSDLEGQAVSAAQCDDPRFLELGRWVEQWVGDPAGRQYSRKLWEWLYIYEATNLAGLLRPGASAVGFGCGNEPLPAMFASHGVEVLATDQGIDGAQGEAWAATGQLMGDLAGFSRPHIVDDAELARLVRLREVDMNAVPADIGTFDIAWSSCVIEHLGSPQRGMDFIVESCDLLNPGGIAVHTTEMELTSRAETADYGHCAVYRIDDLMDLQKRLAEIDCTASFNFHVSMDTPADRWISMLAMVPEAQEIYPDRDGHLKLALFDSVSTSYGVIVRKNG